METATKAGDKVVAELEMAAPPARVYEALISPDQLGKWWGSAETYQTSWTVDARVGGEYLCRATMAGGVEMTVGGRFLVMDPPRRLSYTWNASWDPSGETRVDYELIARGETTLVRVTQSGFAPGADRAGYQDGWPRILEWLNGWLSRPRNG